MKEELDCSAVTSILAFRPLKQDWIIVAALSTLNIHHGDHLIDIIDVIVSDKGGKDG